jgi:hypothetical protein
MDSGLLRLVRTPLHGSILSFCLASVCVVPTEARTWRVPQELPTIQAGVNAAFPGDDVLVSPGTYVEQDIQVRRPIWIHSTGGAAVTIIAGPGDWGIFDLVDIPGTTTIEGFTIHGGSRHDSYGGGGIHAWSADVAVKACLIRDCDAFAGGGILAIDSFLLVEDSEFADNRSEGGGAINVASFDVPVGLTVSNSRFFRNFASAALGGSVGGAIIAAGETSISDCVFAGNRIGRYGNGAVMWLGYDDATVTRCTIVDNESYKEDGSIIDASYGGFVRIEGCIIAFNTGLAVRCYGDQTTIACSDVYENSGGSEICGTDGGGNFAADPLFCDFDGGNYNLINTSPCLPGQHPDGAACGLIGAFGTGCESTPVERTSWGRIKGLYRP